MLLGFDLAYHKGQRGRSITWIGYSMYLEADMIRVSIKESSTTEFAEVMAALRRGDIVSLYGSSQPRGRASLRMASLLGRTVGGASTESHKEDPSAEVLHPAETS